MSSRRRFVVERAPEPITSPIAADGAAVWVFVHCSLCDKFISDEERHECELTWAQQHERDTMRAAKITAVANARSRAKR